MEKRTAGTEFLDEKLMTYGTSDYYPFHMPGHKRNMKMEADLYSIDITEIEGFDNLHDAREILGRAQERAADLYGAGKSYYLVNGSTCGILSAVSAAVKKGGNLLMARNCHKAVYHAAYLRELSVSYLYPVITAYGIQGVITPESVYAALCEDPDIQAVILTSPTYDGIVSDIAAIAEIVHRFGIPLIVDEAHGAHLGFHSYFPETAVRLGADVVIQSMHKTLPSFTQTALLHLNSERISGAKIEQFLDIYETSSPSYVLMAGMDRCVRILTEQSKILFEEYANKLKAFYRASEKLNAVKVLRFDELPQQECYRTDSSKIVISARESGLSGKQLYEILLEQYHLQMEMCSGDYVLAMTSILDTQEGFDRLWQALHEVDQTCEKTGLQGSETKKEISGFIARMYAPNEKAMEISEAADCKTTDCMLDQAVGKIAGDYIYLYPPGIPVLVPGERITGKLIENIRECVELGLDIKGVPNLRINIVN